MLFTLPPAFIALLFVHCVAILSTLVRLGHRFHRQQLWWDDFWAFVALLAAILVIAIWLYLSLSFDVYLQAPPTRSFILWVTFFSQPSEIWATRLSIACTVVRLLPPGPNRTISKGTVVAFILMWLPVFTEKFFLCGYPMPEMPICNFSNATPILDLTMNLIADCWLICWPAYILIRMKLPSTHRRLLLACFSASILLIIVSGCHAVFILRRSLSSFITGHLQVSVSLLVCNLLVLATYVYRVYRDSGGGPATVTSQTEESGRPITRALRDDFSTDPSTGQITDERPKRQRMRSWSLKSMSFDLSRLGSTFNRQNHAMTETRTQMTDYRARSPNSIGPLTTVDTGSFIWRTTDDQGRRTPTSGRTGPLTSVDFGLISGDAKSYREGDDVGSTDQESFASPIFLSTPQSTSTLETQNR